MNRFRAFDLWLPPPGKPAEPGLNNRRKFVRLAHEIEFVKKNFKDSLRSISYPQQESATMKFARFCQSLSNWAGSSKTFLLAIVLIAVWATTGPYFHYNDTLATDHQHFYNDHHLPHDVPDSKHSKPR